MGEMKMAISNKERIIFAEIQKKLFYMIPEKWDAIYLYASIIEEPFKKPVGEMYFYYLPKGILKRKPVNVYQIPSMFNIDEEGYNEIVQRLYSDIRNLREVHRETKAKLWTNFTISIRNYQFKIEYGYEDLRNSSEFSPYERHIIWRYKNLEVDSSLMTREEKSIIDRYLNSELIQLEKENNDVYVEGVYKQPVHNIIDYEKTLTVEAAIASNSSRVEEKPELEQKEKKVKKVKVKDKDVKSDKESYSGSTLFGRVDKMKKGSASEDFDIDDDMILSSDFMTKKEP